MAAYCAVLFFDEQNANDAVVIAVYPNGSQGVPSPAPGRLVMVTPVQQINAVAIASDATQTFAMATNIPVCEESLQMQSSNSGVFVCSTFRSGRRFDTVDVDVAQPLQDPF